MARAHRHHERFCKGCRRGESGAFAIMFVPLLVVILGFYGLALDIGFVYNRKAELQGVAQSIAVAAARELNGTAAGVSAALAKAAEEARRKRVGYGRAVPWSDAAIAFGSSPDGEGEWIGADTARGAPANRYYVKVDTRQLDQDIGEVGTLFFRILTQAHSSMSVSERAVAGRSAVDVTPLAICAMSAQPGAARTNPGPPTTVELVEYGFRRGVGYDLMNLNPLGSTPANFVLDPESPPGAAGSASNTGASVVAPFICTGRVWMTGVTGGAVRVGSPFPIAALYRELNARFEQYTGSVCGANGAPPDFNVKAFSHGASGGAAWMKARASHPSALRAESATRLQTIADLAAPPGGTAPGAYGPLWAYAKAVKFADYVAGSPEPEAGYTPFATSDWPSLYPASPATESASYPSKLQPYQAASGANYGKPSNANLPISVPERRVLNVPLLACPVPAGSNVGAQVLAIGKFFMTVPATDTSIHAEFAGIVPAHKLTGQVVLYP